MAGSRTLKLSILADVDNLKKELDKGSKEVEGFGDKLQGFSDKAKVAFAAAAAAAGAYAVKLAVDGVKAAIADQAAQERLATALENVTGATNTQIAAVEKQILKTSLATGVADDKLRPAFQRLAIATGDLTMSSDLLTLALDISAATGKDVETVSNALGKAYEGNTGALTRLGIGLSATEIRTLGLQGAVTSLGNTFGGAAATQAETYEGKIARVNVAFEEAKEKIGEVLLPILERFFIFITETAIPKMEEFKERAIDPVSKAFKENEETIRALIKVGTTLLKPFLEVTLVNSLKGLAKVASFIGKAVELAIKALQPIINAAIAGINAIIAAKNALLPGADTPPIPSFKFGSSTNTGSNSVPSSSLPSGFTGGSTSPIPSMDQVSGSIPKVTSGSSATPKVGKIEIPRNIPGGVFDPSAFRRGQERDRVTINVNGAIDPASTARQIVDLLNTEAAVSGSFTNLGSNRFATRAE